ncbi:transcriptional regulator [Promicromonospora iranensis]|uniref:DNA-binding MarR family transcriptional regulator n=1 Tax=Promicromonospora iranensis TaxID=1105144 RepID=A0ABU2CLE1_9MICO|nr:transcriptional regulator [Promicromonospora iranensis]MDR7382128.1 DNA-binding MarR family transcriptional regulator [Promicromonospora iranensis]
MTFRDIDAHLIAPKRFVTLAHLHQVEQADYPALQEATALSTPDLSKIIRDLEERGLVLVTKERRTRYGATVVRLTPEGQEAFKKLLNALNRIAGQ